MLGPDDVLALAGTHPALTLANAELLDGPDAAKAAQPKVTASSG